MSAKETAVAYQRVSSEDQRDGFSLDAQEESANKYAKDNSLRVVRSWKNQESASKEDHRKIFDEMLDYVRASSTQLAITPTSCLQIMFATNLRSKALFQTELTASV